MKIPLRIVVPVLAAVLVSVSVLMLIWWQLTITSERLRSQINARTGDEDLIPGVTDGTGPDTGDAVLLHLRQGDLAGIQGEWAEAEREYTASVNAGGGIPALRKLAQAQLQRRNIEGVEKTIRRLDDAGAKEEDLLLLRTIVLLRTGELVQTREVLEKAADSPQKHYGLALLAVVQGGHDTAKQELALVLAGWDPILRSYARTLQTAYEEFGLFPQGQHIHLIALLARSLAQVQECELALPLLSQVLAGQNDYRDAWVVQGYCELTTERFNEALTSFEKAYNIDPEKPEIQYFLGRTYMALGEHPNAVTFLSYALENGFRPEKEVRKRLAQEAAAVGKNELALEQLDALAREPDADIATFEQLIALGIAAGRTEESYAAAKTAIQKWPESAKAHELVGWTSAVTNRIPEARTALEKALEIDPTLQSARERLSKL